MCFFSLIEIKHNFIRQKKTIFGKKFKLDKSIWYTTHTHREKIKNKYTKKFPSNLAYVSVRVAALK